MSFLKLFTKTKVCQIDFEKNAFFRYSQSLLSAQSLHCRHSLGDFRMRLISLNAESSKYW